MTLHITQISRRYTLQVSDRLISGGVQDPIANKNLIYWGRGAVVSIGYTGLAYGLSRTNRNMPTDEWIAETLWGMPIPRGPNCVRPITLSYRKICRWLDIGQSIQLLCDELQNSLDRLSTRDKKLPFELIVAGWQEKLRRGVYPVVVQIIKPKDETQCVINRPERNWYFGNRFGFITTPDGWIPKEERSIIGKTLQSATPDESEDLLVKSIRCAASQNSGKIGPHCLSILLPPPGVAPIRVRFIPSTPHAAVFTSKTQNIRRELPAVAFSPWIIGPNILCAPSVQIGRSYLQMGPFEINIEAPAPEKGILGYSGAQHRPLGPRRKY